VLVTPHASLGLSPWTYAAARLPQSSPLPTKIASTHSGVKGWEDEGLPRGDRKRVLERAHTFAANVLP
jgi:hypothetical protein